MNKKETFNDTYGDPIEVIRYKNGEVTILFKEDDKDPIIMAFDERHVEQFKKIAEHLEREK